MGMIKEIRVPDIGDFKNVDVIEVLVAAGDKIAAEDPLITLESDKASMEVPAPAAGVVKELKLKPGDKVSQGDLILLLEASDSGQAENLSAAAPAAAPEKPRAAGAAREVRVPNMGDFKDVDIVEVLVAPGDSLAVEQPIIILESDKASMEVPSPAAGVVQEVKVKAGDKVSQGDLILLLEAEEGPPSAEASAVPEVAPPAPVALGPKAPKPSSFEPRPPVTALPVEEKGFTKAHASPSVRRFARELAVDLSRIGEGSGAKGRITKEDVQNFVKQVMAGQPPAPAAPAPGAGIPPIPAVDFAKFGEIETQPLSKIKRLTGINLSRNWLNVPHVTHHDEADITETEAFRKSLSGEAEQRALRVTLLSFLLKACAVALKAFPSFNASLDPGGDHLIIKKYIHIGVAVDTPEGLVVPVIRDVDRKSIFELSKELGEYSDKARAKKLMPGDMQGACFTISSLGGIGGTAFTPIVNAPEVAILGVTRAQLKPIWNGKEFVPRLMLPLSLSYDHRVIDGAQAARFVSFLVKVMSDLRQLLL
jgi:pyruvate dehydrogenase E2 component (dihydrolipoamide acetyltransferase)